MKKNIAKLLVLAMLLTMVPFAAAAGGVSGGGGGGDTAKSSGTDYYYQVVSDVSVAEVAADLSKAANGVETTTPSTPYQISVDVSADKVSAQTDLTVLVHFTPVSGGSIHTLNSATASIPESGGTPMTFDWPMNAQRGTLSGKLDLSDVKDGGTKYFGLAIKVTTQSPEFYMVYYRLTVNVKPAEGSTYAVNAYAMPSAGGTVKASVSEAKEGDKVTVSFQANEGYEFTSIDIYGFGDKLATATPTDGKHEFTMPATDVDVEVKFKLQSALVETAVERGEAKIEATDPSFTKLDSVTQEQVKTAIGASTIEVADIQLEDEALTMANTAASNQTLVDQAVATLGVAKDQIQFTAKPVMTMTPKDFISGEKPVLKLDIKGYINVFAEKKSASESDEPMAVGNPQLITKPVLICVPLPFAVTGEDGEQPVAFAGHSGKWQYFGPVIQDEGFIFLNPHGFSEFEIGVEDKTVVSNERIEDEYRYTYLTFAAAAEEAEKGDVLILEEDNAERVTLPAGVTVKLLNDTVKFTGTINGQSVTLNTNGYTVPSTSSSGGGGGGGSSKPSIKPGEKPVTPGATVPGSGVAGFNDVAVGAWYADSVKYVVEKGLFGGVGNGNFAPEANMTRAMMWTVLARYMGVNTDTGSNWYEAARAWAIEKGISDGTMADGNVTREQFVTMLWRLSGEPAVDSAADFTDGGKVSDYAKTAVAWAVSQGIVNGYSDGSFKPQGSATRAEVAKMLTVFCQNAEADA